MTDQIQMAADVASMQFQGTTRGGPAEYFRKDKNGQIVMVEVAPDEHMAPFSGYYKLRWTGVTKPFEMDGQYGRSKNVRIEWTVNMPGNPCHKYRFSELATVARWDNRQETFVSNLGPKSKLGQAIAAFRGKPIEDGEPVQVLDYLNAECMAMVQQDTKATDFGVKAYGKTVKDTIQPVGQEAMAEIVNAPTATAPKGTKAAAAAAPAANPFTDSDDLD